MRYRLRTLMIVLAILPPIIAGVFHFHYRNWCALKVLRSLERAQIRRDGLLATWRVTFDRAGTGQQEEAIREQYFMARQDFEKEKASIEARYGSIEAARHLGAQAQIFER
jgi:hypothetical protein